ncbi:hypothetical protein [Longimicrobium sp.]|uniref:hypothetical protein n=1 Tax=Longimicrobium sp. TaxID=2029185 RepID=UPI003B3A951E
MSDLLDVREVRVPRDLAEAAREHLRAAGEEGCEAFVLWAGKRGGDVFEVLATLVPRQTAHRTPSGLLVEVDGDELLRLNVWLYDNGLQLVTQLHAHPGEAYHSETDDRYPIMAQAGGLSLVLPDFAVRPFDVRDLAAHRLLPGRGWIRLSGAEIETLLKVVD